MSLDARFWLASESAEEWVGLLSEFRFWAERAENPDPLVLGNPTDAALVAWAKLVELCYDVYCQGPAIDAAAGRLEAVAEEPVVHHGMLGSRTYRSAHR